MAEVVQSNPAKEHRLGRSFRCESMVGEIGLGSNGSVDRPLSDKGSNKGSNEEFCTVVSAEPCSAELSGRAGWISEFISLDH